MPAPPVADSSSHPDPARVAEWLAASCAAQGVPVLVTDLVVLRRVARLLGDPDVACAPASRRGPAPTLAATGDAA